MTPQTARQVLSVRKSTTQRARQYLSGGAVTREDSDDELGLEDHPWEWIFQDAAAQHNDEAIDTSDNSEARESSPTNERRDVSPSRRKDLLRRHARPTRQIVGARMGRFECRVGDCVLLKAEGTNEAWVGLICEFQEEEEDDGKVANFMWFSTEKEIRNKQKKRSDSMQVVTELADH